MARKSTRIPLNVYLNGRLVGRLQRETSGAIEFQYDDSWRGALTRLERIVSAAAPR